MAAGVQDHDGGGRGGMEAGQHGFKVHAAFVGVVISVVLNRKACVGEQGAVVFPAGVGYQNLGVGVQTLQEISPDFQTAGTANALDGCHAVGCDRFRVRAKDQAFDCCVVGCNAVNGQVAARCGRGHQGFFSGLYALQQGQLPVVVEINTHTEVDFMGVGVSVVLFVEAQDRVAGGHFDGGKERHG